MLALQVTFLTGRYVATEYNDRRKAEWPPHPARLYSALVAAHASEPEIEEAEALRWLERQGPPEIAASPATEREVVTVFVPVNDQGQGIDESRVRQPRTFPSSTPADPRVVVIWPTAHADARHRAALDRLCQRVVRLGHSSSLVSVRVADEHPPATWKPAADGDRWLRVVREGQLGLLGEAYQRHRETESGRVMPAAFQLYSDRPEVARAAFPQSEFSTDWVVLRRTSGPALPIVAGPAVAESIRRALLRFGPQPPREMLSGHAPRGEPSEKSHAAIVPLPFVGHKNADGRLIGVALVVPWAASDAERRSLYLAVRAWEDASRKGDEEIPEIPVLLGTATPLGLTRLDEEAEHTSLIPSTWCRPASTWLSATPLALDRNPGDLRSRDPHVAAKAYADAEITVTRACERIGLPAPEEVTILPAAPLVGSAKARAYPRFPANTERLQRVLIHAALQFKTPVRGPILVGAGRYVGLGLFRPVRLATTGAHPRQEA